MSVEIIYIDVCRFYLEGAYWYITQTAYEILLFKIWLDVISDYVIAFWNDVCLNDIWDLLKLIIYFILSSHISDIEGKSN